MKVRFILFLLVLLPAFVFGQRSRNPALAPVEDNPNLPRVLLIGDSISIGYTLPTREALKGKANVHRIPANAGHTGMGIAGLAKWLAPAKGDWDVIHFNWGLWDLCYRHPNSKEKGRRDKVNGTQTHSIEKYTANLERIIATLKQTGAALVFATTTPVPEGETSKIGDAWIESGRSVVLSVPSAVVSIERNVLLNPTHPDMSRIQIGAAESLRLYKRL